jgi:CheY-like chemotaxis protein
MPLAVFFPEGRVLCLKSEESNGLRLECKPVRIVAMTANAMQGDRERCITAGMDDHIVEPLDLEDLKRVLETSIGIQIT